MKQIIKSELTVAILIISLFIFIVSLSSIYTYSNISKGTACSCAFPIYLIIPLLSSAGLAVGSFVYYSASGKVREVRDKKEKITASVFSLFSSKEREIVKKIAENKEVTQADLNDSTGLSRVKIHRTLSSLEKRGIIKRKKRGKTYLLDFTEDFQFLNK